MPVCGLPQALESMLNSLIGENKLTSWRISGGKDFIGVSLRFHSVDSSTGVTGDIMYRSKPPSQVVRDRQRRNNWYVNKNQSKGKEPVKSNDNLNNIAKTDESNLAGERSQSTITTGSTHGMSDLLIGTDDIILTQSPHTNGQDTKGQDTGQCVSMSVNEPTYYPCDECKQPISTNPKTVCWTCTHCEDFAICTECNNKGIHKKHPDQLHKFVVPEINDNVYCRCCGYVFKTSQNKLYHCTVCEDGYILCLKCHGEGMHRKHLYDQELMTRKSYLA